ncbi:MAG: four helix bundle protein [Ferruginibacter sp.]
MYESKGDNLIVELTFQFALNIIQVSEILILNHKYVISKQLLRSGTSIGANVREAQNAESRADFIHKMKIAAKETDETYYWLLLCKNSKEYDVDCDQLITECFSIGKMLSKIIASARKNVFIK